MRRFFGGTIAAGAIALVGCHVFRGEPRVVREPAPLVREYGYSRPKPSPTPTPKPPPSPEEAAHAGISWKFIQKRRIPTAESRAKEERLAELDGEALWLAERRTAIRDFVALPGDGRQSGAGARAAAEAAEYGGEFSPFGGSGYDGFGTPPEVRASMLPRMKAELAAIERESEAIDSERAEIRRWLLDWNGGFASVENETRKPAE